MKFPILVVFSCLVLIGLTSAAISDLGEFKVGECIDLPQTCATCTYNNLSVFYPNSTTILDNVAMEKDGVFYNYTFCSTNTIGTYSVNGFGDPSGVVTIFNYIFTITPSGFGFNLQSNFLIIVIILSVLIIWLGIWKGDAPTTLLGTFGLYFLGIYILFNGIAGIRDQTTTLPIAIIILGIAFYISVKAALEMLDG